ncbi:MAG: amidohydrolase family protein [Planctomycetota bacterium]|jgi:imidazolonepropionase-like amidohydrolase
MRYGHKGFCGLWLLFFAASIGGRADGREVKPLAFTNAVIIDGDGGEPIEKGIVVIRGDVIDAVGPMDKVKPPADARIIDAEGKTLMPGLADMHIHLASGWDGWSMNLLGYRKILNALLYAGVTTVLDTGNVQPFVLQLRQEIAAGRLLGPRIFCAGPLLDGADPIWPHISFPIASLAQIPKLVNRLNEAGVDVLKAYVGLSPRAVEALVRAGEKVALPVLVDQWSQNGSIDLMQTGMAAFAHMPFRPMPPEAVRMMKERDILCLTTLAVYESFSRNRLKDLTFLDNPLVVDTTPPKVLKALREEAARPETPADAERRAKYGQVERAMKNAKKLFDAGVRIVAGTDAPYPGVFPGEGIHRELALLVEAGLTPLQALSTATRNPGAWMAGEGGWGVLAPGMRADMILIAGRPDRDIAHTRNVVMVIREGKILEREKLKLDPEKTPVFYPYRLVSGGE